MKSKIFVAVLSTILISSYVQQIRDIFEERADLMSIRYSISNHNLFVFFKTILIYFIYCGLKLSLFGYVVSVYVR